MKPRFSSQRNRAFTLPELLVILAIIALMAVLVYPGGSEEKKRAQRVYCVSNLKQVSLAVRIWEGDNETNNAASTTNLFTMEWDKYGNALEFFRAMSNELVTPKILICPSDTDRTWATNFQNDFNGSHISYFINPDASQGYPQMILSGDANLAVDGVPVKSGLVTLSSPANVSWTAARHGHVGNISFADGSVSEVSITGLQQALEFSTNGTPTPIVRLAIP